MAFDFLFKGQNIESKELKEKKIISLSPLHESFLYESLVRFCTFVIVSFLQFPKILVIVGL